MVLIALPIVTGVAKLPFALLSCAVKTLPLLNVPVAVYPTDNGVFCKLQNVPVALQLNVTSVGV